MDVISPGGLAVTSSSDVGTDIAIDWRKDYPFRSLWLELGMGRMHYVDEGVGDSCLLMVHGNPTWSFLWRHLIRGLRSEHRCVAMDHIGCGLSDKPRNLHYTLPVHVAHLTRLIDQLELRNITLVAHDWGGPIGLLALLARRDCFRRIVLFNTGAFPPPFIPWRIRACRFPWLGQWGVQGLNLFARAAQYMAIADPRKLTSRAKAGLIAPYDCWSHRRAIYEFVRDIPTSTSHPTWKYLAQLEAALPALKHLRTQLIWGMRDWCFRPSCLTKLRVAWPQSDIVELANVGHWVTEEAPDEVLHHVQRFLRYTSAESNEASRT